MGSVVFLLKLDSIMVVLDVLPDILVYNTILLEKSTFLTRTSIFSSTQKLILYPLIKHQQLLMSRCSLQFSHLHLLHSAVHIPSENFKRSVQIQEGIDVVFLFTFLCLLHRSSETKGRELSFFQKETFCDI